MPTISLTGLESRLNAPGPISRGRLQAQLWAGTAPYIGVADDAVTFPSPVLVDIVNGAPLLPVVLPATGASCCVRWDIECGRFRLTRYTTIPAANVDFGDLVDVDPETFVPTPNAVAGWAAAFENVPKRAAEAVYRRIIQRRPSARKVMASPPTVALSAASAATSIAGGFTFFPKRKNAINASGGLADMVYDPHFSFLGAPQDTGKWGTVTPDNNLINWSDTGGLHGVPSSQVARWDPRVGMTHTGRYIEFIIKGLQNPNYYRLTVNGEYATEDMQSIATSNTGAVYRLIVDFGSTATRDLVLEIDQFRFGGVTIEPTATVHALAPSHFKAAIVSDSIGGGASSVRRRATVYEIACMHLGIDHVYNLSVGGTGFINNNADGLPFSARIIDDLTRTDPDLIILAGGYNDRSNAGSAIQAAAETAIATILANHPKAALFVVGSWSPGTADSAIVTANEAVKAAAATYNVPFVDILDPTGAGVTAANYDASLTYRFGEPVLYQGVLYIATATSTAIAFNAANWRAASAIFGTGNTTTPTGNGNADVAVGSDGVHPTILGAKLVGSIVARRIWDLAYARIMAAGG